MNEDLERLKKICLPFFHRYDLDNNKQLSKEELAQLLRDLGAPATGDILNQLMREHDTDKDEHINFEEFTSFLCELGLNEDRWIHGQACREGRHHIPDEDHDEEGRCQRISRACRSQFSA